MTARRLFFALWPEPACRQALAEAMGRFKSALAARWIRPDSLHMTLAFLGEVEAERLAAATAAAATIRSPGFELALDGIEHWRKPQILCLTPSRPCAELERLAAGLAGALKAQGFALESRPYRAHLTLARKAAWLPPEVRLERAVAWRSSAFALVESRQDAQGSRYVSLQSWPLSPD
jgi:2'-5' RNA ligase